MIVTVQQNTKGKKKKRKKRLRVNEDNKFNLQMGTFGDGR